jgi:hypothetical protein
VLQAVHEEFKQHYQKLEQDYNERGKALINTIAEKKAMEEAYETAIKHYRLQLDQHQRRLQELQSKSQSVSETDDYKFRVTREIDVQFQHKYESMTQEIEKLESEVPYPLTQC